MISFICRASVYRIQKRNYYLQHKIWNPNLTAEMKQDIENYWRDKINPCDESMIVPKEKKFYVLSMFPYPSGKLHMGHVRVYTISDSLARFYRMLGKHVIHPMGWDAFGLPAENAAISQNSSAEEWTKSNITYMKQQLVKLGLSFDWHREITTCSPEYYKWTQFIFLKLYEHGYVYQKEALVNWDPVDQTVLAEEQVDANGCSWRSGAKVEKRPLKQWFIRTTKLSQSLLEGLEDPCLSDWGDIIKLQKHWIGDCNGYRFDLPLTDCTESSISVWSDNPELLKSSSFIGIKSDHILNKENFRDNSSIKLKIHVRNPLNGCLLPIVISDELDYPEESNVLLCDPTSDLKAAKLAAELKIPMMNLDDSKSTDDICQEAKANNWGGYKASSKLRDWLVSRQRYWGTPIPIIHCQSCGTQPVPLDQLPVTLPGYDGTFKGHSVLLQNEKFYQTSCPRCGNPARRETDTMDTFVDSTWYYLRYLDPQNTQAPFDPEHAKDAMPVDIYIGGKEHAVLHLFFARFISHFLYSIGWLPQQEPFKRLLVQGMVMGRSYRVKGTGKYLKPEEIDFSGPKPVEKLTNKPLVVAWEKMSKSKFNGVEPETVWNEQGVDTTRLLILANVSPRSSRNWSKDTYPGILNWQNRLWSIMSTWIDHMRGMSDVKISVDNTALKKQEDLWFDARNYYLKGVSFAIQQSQQLSVAITKMQGLTGALKKIPKGIDLRNSIQFERALGAQIIMLAPLAPHFASELWSAFVDNALKSSSDFDWDKPVLEQKWPQTDMDYELDLIFVVNNQELCSLKFPRRDFERLNEAKSLQLLLENETYIRYNSGLKILDVEFEHLSGIQATLSVLTEPKKKPLKN